MDGWHRHGAPPAPDESGPDGHAEYLLYQTLVGAWPITMDRLGPYLVKALREAKLRTSWSSPDERYEAAVIAFATRMLGNPEFMASLESLVRLVLRPGRVNGLAQLLVKLTAPGVPDLYQGTELWDLSLVDPDNRRPVDHALRRRVLAELTGPDAPDGETLSARLDDPDEPGSPKMAVIRAALRVRARHPEAFGERATYEPIAADGEAAEHVVAFERSGQVATIVPRLTVSLGDGWRDTAVSLPAGRWRDELTGQTVTVRSGGRSGVPVSRLLSASPWPCWSVAGAGEDRIVRGRPLPMTAFRVWAPRPARVDLVSTAPGRVADDEPQAQRTQRPMRQGDDGWWLLDVPDSAPGADYGFVLDGEGPFPDPRSPSQPNGVHGLSRTVDHAAFPWSDAGWTPPPLDRAVIYELHVGTFSAAGTFDGVIGHLDQLVDLGITHLELMPVVEFPGNRGWGYDGVDLFAPHHAYGGPDGLKRLVDACHARGLAVLIDVVWNHLGPDGNYLGRFGPYFTDRYRTPWGAAVNFDDAGSDEVRAFVLDNARMWLEDYHADGLRIDAVHAIFDQSATNILETVATAVHALGDRLGRPLVAIAESDLNDPRLVRDVALGGYGLDAQWNDDFRHALHVAVTGESDGYHGQYDGIPDLATALRNVFVYDGRYSAFRGRSHGRPVGALPATRFVGYLQNHDQVGNRALGERISQLVPPEAVRAAAAIVLLGPFVPLLFAGEEWAASSPFLYFTDHGDENLAAAVREGRRREFAELHRDGIEVPDPQAARDVRTIEARLERADAYTVRIDARLVPVAHRFRASHPDLSDGTRPEVTADAGRSMDRARPPGRSGHGEPRLRRVYRPAR